MMTTRPTRRTRLLATASAHVCGKGPALDVPLASTDRALVGNDGGGGRHSVVSVLKSRSGPSGTTLPRALPKETA